MLIIPRYLGQSPYRNIDLGPTGDLVNDGPTLLCSYVIGNSGASRAYLKLYDKATAPTADDTPVWTIMLPAGGAGNVNLDPPLYFAAGLGIRATTGVADADTAAPGGNEVVVNLGVSQ